MNTCDICQLAESVHKYRDSYFKLCDACDKLELLKAGDIADLLNLTERALAYRISKGNNNYPPYSYSAKRCFSALGFKKQNLWERSVVDKFFKDNNLQIRSIKTLRNRTHINNNSYSKTNLLFNKNISRQLQD